MIGKKRIVLQKIVLGLVLVAGLGMGTTSPASAQMSGAGGFAELNVHDYLHRDIVLFAQALEMDEGQRVIVESIYEDYRSAFDAGWARTQQRFTDMREELQNADREQVMNMVLAPFENWQREKQQIKEQFEQNVRVILNPTQLERWPAFQRQMLREKSLHRGRLSGESLNLFHVLRDLRLSDRQRMALDSTMEQYDLALHQALVERNTALQDAQNAMMRSIRNPEAATDMSRTRQEVQRRVALRNVNDQYIEVIAAALPTEYGDEFRDNALERAYPRVFRPLPAVRLFEEAEKIDGLDPQTRASISSLKVAMLEEFATFNMRLHQGVRDHEPAAAVNQAEIAAARQTGDEVERLTDPNIVTYRQRDERANHYVSQLRDLLEPEQFAALPGSSRWIPQRRAQQVTEPGAARGRDQRTREEAESPSGGAGTLAPSQPSRPTRPNRPGRDPR